MNSVEQDALISRILLSWTTEIPPRMRQRYREHRHKAFLSLIEKRSSLLVLAFVALLSFTLLFHGSQMSGHDLWVFLSLESIVVLALGGGLYTAHSKLAQSTDFSDWVSCLFGGVAALKVATALLVVSKPLAQNETYMVFLTLLVGVLGLQLSRQQARIGIALGALGFLVAPWGQANATELWHLVGQYTLTGVVCLFIAILKEDNDRAAFLQSCQLDVEQHRAALLAEQLSHLANQDILTKLSNRRYFEERLRDEWIRCAYKEQELSLLMLDVDHFKAFNAAHGNAAGDQCLFRIAEQLRCLMNKPSDLPARYSGNEFVVLLPDTDVVQAYQLATKLLMAVEQERILHKASPLCGHVTLSIGVASCRPRFKRSPDMILEMADQAVDSAKRKGRGCVSLSSLVLP